MRADEEHDDMTTPWFPYPALSGATYSAAELGRDNDRVFLLDQRDLPLHETYVELRTSVEVATQSV